MATTIALSIETKNALDDYRDTRTNQQEEMSYDDVIQSLVETPRLRDSNERRLIRARYIFMSFRTEYPDYWNSIKEMVIDSLSEEEFKYYAKLAEDQGSGKRWSATSEVEFAQREYQRMKRSAPLGRPVRRKARQSRYTRRTRRTKVR